MLSCIRHKDQQTLLITPGHVVTISMIGMKPKMGIYHNKVKNRMAKMKKTMNNSNNFHNGTNINELISTLDVEIINKSVEDLITKATDDVFNKDGTTDAPDKAAGEVEDGIMAK